jgi:gliding motility-associated-like protein
MKRQIPNPKFQIPNKFKNPNPKSQIKSNIAQSPNRSFVKSSNLPIIVFLLLSASLFSQNQANIWYFGESIGLDFNSGIPVPTYEITCDGDAYSVMCDTNGNFLFFSNGITLLNRNGLAMPNGDTIIGDARAMMGSLILQKPGSDHLYYVFTVDYDDQWGDNGMHYSVVDMNLDGGLGDVTAEKDIPLDMAWAAKNKLTSVRHANGEDIWIVTRNFKMNQWYAAFLLTASGLSTQAVLSPVPERNDLSLCDEGTMKISPDKKYLVAAYNRCNCIEELKQSLDICRFNDLTGQINLLYTLSKNTAGFGEEFEPYTVEFSPDSKLLYISYSHHNLLELYQYDVQYIEDSILFKQSEIYIDSGMVNGLQLARDGKIYCSGKVGELYKYVSVINDPWKRGPACNYQVNAIYFDGRRNNRAFPNMLSDYLYRFEWTGELCQGYPVNFKPNFIPTPDSIVWNFDDQLEPGSQTNVLSPTYAFQHPGVHEIRVDVWYPSGRYEHTSREIEINPSPQPDLGPDTLICQGASITLSANCDADFFSWSTGQFVVSSITVSDSGTYWVRARYNGTGCATFDTIHIGFRPPTLIDETNLIITPTTCNGASGSITGLVAGGTPPLAYRWVDLSEVEYGTEIDVFGLPAGQYLLEITDVNGCETVSDVYTIEDAGNLQVLNVELTQPHCGRPDGQIIVHGFNPAGSALQYSIDDGATYQADSVFSGLVGAGYVVRVTDEFGCEGFYLLNPVLLEDIPGPQVTQVNVTDETDFLGNGAIEIMANGSTSTIYYSIDGGATWQENDGNFENLVSGIWYLVIKDENGCDTAFTVDIQNVILTYLHAVTGEGEHCLGNTALVPVNVDNFNAVADFHLKLGYNVDNLECEGFANVNPVLTDSLSAWVDQAAGDIHLAWKSPASVTFPGTEKVADLVFTTKNPGQGQLAWYTGETESYFTNTSGIPIPAQFSTGEVTVYEPPEIILSQSKTVCTGQFVNILSVANGNQSPISYRWIYPNGDTTTNDPMYINVYPTDGGIYTLLATDHVGCTDQKSIELIVSDNPVASFHGTDTLEMHAGDLLDAGEGMASYKWNTGDSTNSLVIESEGVYWLEMISQVGCIGSDSVYVKLVSEEIPEFEIYVPNAFSPNGDGVNDVFRVVADGSRIEDLKLRIYDRWGGQVFDSSVMENGWDGKKNGKDCPGGVYVYKIIFSVDGVPGNQERAGTVMLVR